MLCASLKARFYFFLGDYDQLLYFALLLIYIQIGCSLVGSLGALFNGVSLINLVIALFALVAIESSSQSLGRTYAVLLFCGILLDIFWFILFSHQIWSLSSGDYEPLFILSLRLTLCMQIVGFFVRMVSSLLWIQIYRLGASNVQNTISRAADLQNSFLNPPTPAALGRQRSHSDEILGGSIFEPDYYSSLFESAQDNRHACEGNPLGISDDGGSVPAAESSQLKACFNRAFVVNDSNTKSYSDNEIVEIL